MANLTLFNIVYNAETERTEFTRTYLYDIRWQSEQAYTVQDKGLMVADKITCFISFDCKVENNKSYKTPGEFIRLNPEEVKNYFTFKKGDFIVKGIVDFELSNYESGKKISDLEKLYEVGTIVSVITNDFGSKNLRHWEVGAK